MTNAFDGPTEIVADARMQHYQPPRYEGLKPGGGVRAYPFGKAQAPMGELLVLACRDGSKDYPLRTVIPLRIFTALTRKA